MPEKEFKIKFMGAEIVSKMIAQPSQEILDKPQNFNFDFLVDVKVSAEKKSAVAVTDISITDITKSKNLAVFKTICVFELPDFDKYFTKVGGKQYDIDIDLEIILKSTGISTTRGMVVSELRGTYLHNAILPLVDMAKLVRDGRDKKEKEKKNKSA